MPWFALASYGAAVLAYGVSAAMLIIGYPAGSRRAALLVATMVASAVWAGSLIVLLLGSSTSLVAVVGLDALHGFVWTLCVTAWLAPRSVGLRLVLFSASACGLAILAAWWVVPATGAGWAPYAMVVMVDLVGLLAVEQVLRNAKDLQRMPLQLLCIAAGGVFALDMFVYSQAMVLDGRVSPFWEMRGLGNALLVPLVVVATKRQAEWETELFVSRQVVFYTASLVGVGAYLLAMGLVAYALRFLGGNWSPALELCFLVAVLAVLSFALFSTRLRARFKVFLVKHFYRNKYDYREEWLRLTKTLGRSADLPRLSLNALDGLAHIVGSGSGSLWVSKEPQRYEWIASIDGVSPSRASYAADHPIVAFLRSRGWVIDTEEYRREPDRYGTSFGDPHATVLPSNAIIVPLDCQGYLQGFAILERPSHLQSLNFEDHDILKTAGRQVAVVLSQAMAQESLAETRQFEATSKLTTFLMHDLKNVVAQQQLVVANAQKFRHRPDFIDDAIATIRSGADRMRGVLEQLQGAARAAPVVGRVDVTKVVMEVRSHCADRQPIPEWTGDHAGPRWVSMDREKLVSALTHLIRNAQDATAEDGRVAIEIAPGDGELTVTVTDTGKGMDQEFIRDRLFRPFDTTKGASGMGIGAYQVRETVRAAGGEVEVGSEIGSGTTFKLRLPVDRLRTVGIGQPLGEERIVG